MAGERVYPLDGVRADGWFDNIRSGSPNIERIVELVGEMPLAFSIILGVQISAISIDPRNRDASVVDFVIGDDTETHRMALGEFRRRIGATLAAEGEIEPELPEDPDDGDLERFIGTQYLLLSSVFGLTLRELVLADGNEPRIRLEIGKAREELALDELRHLIRDRVRDESRPAERTASPFSIDLNTIPEAEEASEGGDHGRTIELLGAWPGPLSVLLRTAEGQQLSGEVKASLGHALGLLGTAYAQTDQSDWAEEVMRLGIQWAQDGPVAGDLFRRLGESHVDRGRAGEAIGLLRRALSLGASPHEVLPPLARCYAERGKMVAAAACVDEARALGVEEEKLSEIAERAEKALGEPWKRFREEIPLTSSKGRTLPPNALGVYKPSEE